MSKAPRGGSFPEKSEARDAVLRVRRAVAGLSAVERQMLLMDADGLTRKEISESIGVAIEVVDETVGRTRRKLRGLLRVETDNGQIKKVWEAYGRA